MEATPPQPGQTAANEGPASDIKLYHWLSPPVLAATFAVMAAGFAQFGAVAALGDVAEQLGEIEENGESLAEQAGLSGTALGTGLAIIRLASLFSLGLAGAADRLGRRGVLLSCCAVGLALTASASLSPTYWWFVAIFAASRPFLTAADTVGAVMAAELTATADRAKAIALIGAGYGVGSGLIAVIHGLGSDVLGFRGVFALALLPTIFLPAIGRRIVEPGRYADRQAASDKPVPVLGAVGHRFRRRLTALVIIAFAVAVVTGPANSFIFLYGENIIGLDPLILSGAVVAGGPAGLVGLLAGRWASDEFGRRPTAAVGLAFIAGAGMVTYSGSAPAAIIGYLAAITGGSVFVPATGAFTAELFPTDVRGAVAGWTVAAGVLGAVAGLAAFGLVADAADSFAPAAVVVFTPPLLAIGALTLIPETRGRELEDWEHD